MKSEEVPQEPSRTYGGERKLIYAVGEDGAYKGVRSAGWDVEAYATIAAIEAIDALRDDALTRARRGETSPLEYHMYRRRMEPDTLASSTGVWKWRLRRHFRPAIFARLAPRLLARYADVLGMTVEELRRIPEQAGD